MHLDEMQVQRVLDGELAPSEERSHRAHLDACDACRARLDDAERAGRELLALLETLDVAPPTVSAAAIIHRAQSRSAPGAAWRWAATVLLIAGTGIVAWAAPGSPVPGLVRRVVALVAGDSQQPAAGAPAADTTPGPLPGISVAPEARLTIEFSDAFRHSIAVLTLTDDSEVRLRVMRGNATFSSTRDRLMVGGAGDSARFEVGVPRAAPYVEIVVGAQRSFLKRGDSIRTDAARAADGRYLIPLAPP
ncbi:MAG TPA: hypothetical protein VLE53_12170 [Gemmatimonadaceae bacterium]|nr:hypothetical protein [Gemmatimonadaceae bacterium]